jgi:hypothetical protein
MVSCDYPLCKERAYLSVRAITTFVLERFLQMPDVFRERLGQ